MTTIHPRNPVRFIGALSVSIAALAAETSAQSRPTPAHPVSDAIAEVLRGPFHVERPPATVHARFLTPSGAPPAPRFRGTQVQSPEDALPRGWMLTLTTLSAALGYGGMFYLAHKCEGDEIVDPSGFPAPCGTSDLCPNEAVIAVTGVATTIAITAGAATYVGSGFRRSLIGSMLGFAGGWTGTVLTVIAIEALGHSVADMTVAVPLATFTLVHAGITTLIAG
jgi:hypothetical protein